MLICFLSKSLLVRQTRYYYFHFKFEEIGPSVLAAWLTHSYNLWKSSATLGSFCLLILSLFIASYYLLVIGVHLFSPLKTFIEDVLCTRHYSRFWDCIREQRTVKSWWSWCSWGRQTLTSFQNKLIRDCHRKCYRREVDDAMRECYRDLIWSAGA